MGFEVSYAQAMPDVVHSLLLLCAGQGVELSLPLQHHVYLHASIFPAMTIMVLISEL